MVDVESSCSLAHILATGVNRCCEVCSLYEFFFPRSYYVVLLSFQFYGQGLWNSQIGLHIVLALHCRNCTLQWADIVYVLSSLESR